MNLVNNIIINLYSIAILIIVYILSSKQDVKESLQNKLYIRILKITILMLVVDIFSRFDGKPGTIYPVINHFGNFMIFLLNPMLSSLWLLYIYVQGFYKEEKRRRLIYLIFAINIVNVVVLVLTQFYGWYYYIDSDNIYHRGPLFWLSVLYPAVLLLVTFLIIIVNNEKLKRNHYFSLIFFALLLFLCIILQVIFYGVSIILNSLVLSSLIVSLNIQDHNIYTDYLTGVHNRKYLEILLKEKISISTENKAFSAIMLDLNDFKLINDTFGHIMGDNALQISAELLSSCLRKNDFIARFGGDEFCIVLDISDWVELEEVACRIKNCFEMYNESGAQPFKISFSMGYAVYDYQSNMDMEEFQKQIDTKMYANKHADKKI